VSSQVLVDSLDQLRLSDVSRTSEISIQIYLRTEEPQRGQADDMGNDIFMGGIKFYPDFDNLGTEDQWYDLSGNSGRIQIGIVYKPSSVCSILNSYL